MGKNMDMLAQKTAAKIAGVTSSTICDWGEKGYIIRMRDPDRLGAFWLYEKTSLLRYVESRNKRKEATRKKEAERKERKVKKAGKKAVSPEVKEEVTPDPKVPSYPPRTLDDAILRTTFILAVQAGSVARDKASNKTWAARVTANAYHVSPRVLRKVMSHTPDRPSLASAVEDYLNFSYGAKSFGRWGDSFKASVMEADVKSVDEAVKMPEKGNSHECTV